MKHCKHVGEELVGWIEVNRTLYPIFQCEKCGRCEVADIPLEKERD